MGRTQRAALAFMSVALVLVSFAACAGDDGTATPAGTRTSRPRSNATAAPTASATASASPTGTASATETATATATSTSAPLPTASSIPADPDLSFPSTESDSAASALFDRKVIQDGSLQLLVANVRQELTGIAQDAATLGGYVAESSLGTETNRATNKVYDVANITVRVPVERFVEAITRTSGRALEVLHQQSSSQDVTQEYVDLESRLTNLENIEARYLVLLGEATTIKDILVVQDRLNRTRAEIEQTRGRLTVLASLTDFSTLRVELRPPEAFETAVVTPTPTPAPVPATTPEPEDSVGDTAANAWDRSFDLLENAAKVTVAVAVFLWWLAIPLAVGAIIWAIVVRTRGRPRAPREPDPAP